jgi:hypothetical protein
VHFIPDDPKLMALYNEAVRGPDGDVDVEKKGVLHR